MLTDTQLKSLKPQGKAYKIADAQGLYVTVATSGTKSFRYDYRLDGKRETLTIGRYEEGTPSRAADELNGLDFGNVLSLADARALHDRAKRMVKAGVSPSKTKIEKRTVAADAQTFGVWADKYFEFKADPKSGGEQLADSTLALRKSIYRRLLEKPLGKKNLDDIKPKVLTELFDKAKAERGPGPAVHARELVLLVYRFAIGKGVEVANPVDSIQRKTIATFQPRERNLDRREIKTFFDASPTSSMPRTKPGCRPVLRCDVLKATSCPTRQPSRGRSKGAAMIDTPEKTKAPVAAGAIESNEKETASTVGSVAGAQKIGNLPVMAPAALRDLPGWLIWKFEYEPGRAKPLKVTATAPTPGSISSGTATC